MASSTVQLMKDAIAAFKENLSADTQYVQKLETLGGVDHAYAVVWATRPEADYLRG